MHPSKYYSTQDTKLLQYSSTVVLESGANFLEETGIQIDHPQILVEQHKMCISQASLHIFHYPGSVLAYSAFDTHHSYINSSYKQNVIHHQA